WWDYFNGYDDFHYCRTDYTHSSALYYLTQELEKPTAEDTATKLFLDTPNGPFLFFRRLNTRPKFVACFVSAKKCFDVQECHSQSVETMHIAAHNGWMNSAVTLLKKFGDKQLEAKGDAQIGTPIHRAIDAGQEKLAIWLI